MKKNDSKNAALTVSVTDLAKALEVKSSVRAGSLVNGRTCVTCGIMTPPGVKA